MNATPKISIIVPCYNQEKYIEECIDSICANDDIPGNEITVVDDCSTDTSVIKILSLIQKYPHINITLIQNPINIGVSAVRNIGISKSNAPIIVCIDGDDKIPTNFLRKNYCNINYNHIDVSYVDSQYFGTKNSRDVFPEFNIQLLRRFNFINCSAMFKKEVWVKTGGFDTEMIYGNEDYEFWLRVAQAGFKIQKEQDTFLLYRQKPELGRNDFLQLNHKAVVATYMKEKHKGWYLGV